MTDSFVDWEDPIIQEIRGIRDGHAKSCDYDLDKIFKSHLQFAEKLLGEGYQVVNKPPKKSTLKTGTIS